jgi:hypothetical protein
MIELIIGFTIYAVIVIIHYKLLIYCYQNITGKDIRDNFWLSLLAVILSLFVTNYGILFVVLIAAFIKIKKDYFGI